MVNVRSLDKAITALSVALELYDKNPLPEDAAEKVLLRDGVIQRFEITFELSWKLLKRYLEEYGLERVDTLTNRDLFRIGQEQGLLADAARWFHYLRMRNQTSHIYDDAKAHEVFRAARDFLPDAQDMIAKLKGKMR